MATMYASRISLSEADLAEQLKALGTGEDLDADPGDEEPDPDDTPTEPGQMPETVDTEDSTDADEEELDPLFEVSDKAPEDKTETPAEETTEAKSYISLKDDEKAVVVKEVTQGLLRELGVANMDEFTQTVAYVKQLAAAQVSSQLTEAIVGFGVMRDAAPQVLDKVMEYWGKLPKSTTEAIAKKEAETGMSPVEQILLALRKNGQLDRKVLATSGTKTTKTKPLGQSKRSTSPALSDAEIVSMSDADYEALSDSMFS